MLVGTGEAHIVSVVSHLLTDNTDLTRMRAATNPFGDGHTSARVADILQRDLGV
jgi:UDP-N-acetylglucosamine 2-epimerase (non-hydrolysing)